MEAAAIPVLVKWDNICNDESWITSLLSWFECRSSSVCLVTEARPLVFDKAQLVNNESSKSLQLASLDMSTIFAEYSITKTSLATDLSVLPQQQQQRHKMPIRYSDLHVVRATPFAFYYVMVAHCVDFTEPLRCRSTKRIEIEILAPIDTNITKWVEVNVQQTSSEEWQFEVFAVNTNIKLCIGRFQVCGDGPVELRYDASKLVGPSQRVKDLATATRENLGERVGEPTPFFKFEMANTNQGNGWLHLADIAVCQARNHAFPAGCEFFTAVQPNGGKQYGCMWRSTSVQILDHSVVERASALPSLVWIDRVGNSTFDLRCDFTSPDTNELVCAVSFTLIVVNVATKKPHKVFFTREWAAARYSYGKRTLACTESFQQPKWLDAKMKQCPVLHTHLFINRHGDADLNGHVNSGKFAILIEDARQEACELGLLPNGGNIWIKNFWIDYIAELRIEHCEVARIAIKCFGPFTRFEIMDNEKLCSVITVESPSQQTAGL